MPDVNLIKTDGYFILPVLLAFAMVGLNALGQRVFALFVSFPAYSLMVKALGLPHHWLSGSPDGPEKGG